MAFDGRVEKTRPNHGSPTDGLYGTITNNVYVDDGIYDSSSATLVSSGPLSIYAPPAGGGPRG